MAHQPCITIDSAVEAFRRSLNSTQEAELLALHGTKTPDANDILTFTAEIDRSSGRREYRCVVSRLHGTLQSLQQFTSIIGTFVSSNPVLAALIWGSVRLTLLTASNFASFFDKLSECFMNLQGCCPRFSEYRFLYPDSLRLQSALCTFYATIVRFCTKAVHAIGRTGKHRFTLPCLRRAPAVTISIAPMERQS